MTINYDALAGSSRLLVEAELKPIQGNRFQPTGFPDLGAARYTAPRQNGNGKPESVEMLLVESPQSVANRLEVACWDRYGDDGNGCFISELDGLPFMRAVLPDGRVVSSTTESHRLNSPFFAATSFQKSVCKDVGYERGRPWDERVLAKWLFAHDPNSLIHGLFFSNIHDGRMRLPRLLSGFIEAKLGIEPIAESGFARREDADPTGKIGAQFIDAIPNSEIKDLGYEKPGEYKSKLKENVKNIIGHRTEFTAERITAFFNLDLAMLRGYSIGSPATHLLVALSLFKIRRFLSTGLRLRTACDLEVVGEPRPTRPDDFPMPGEAELLSDCRRLISECKDLFADPPVTVIEWQQTKKKK